MDFSWAKDYPDLYKVCTLFNYEELLNPVKFSYRPLTSYIQDGPQCGLVALSMVTGSPTKENIDLLFELAKKNNFTYNGEIFSAFNMLELCKEVLASQYLLELYSGKLNCDFIKDFLLENGILLVPYDTDKSNSPSCENGHKAHWCVISGGIQTEDEFYVLACHGKAKNVAVWKLNELSASNSQLFEFSPDRKLQDVQYKLPECGLAGELGLNEKAILIKFL